MAKFCGKWQFIDGLKWLDPYQWLLMCQFYLQCVTDGSIFNGCFQIGLRHSQLSMSMFPKHAYHVMLNFWTPDSTPNFDFSYELMSICLNILSCRSSTFVHWFTFFPLVDDEEGWNPLSSDFYTKQLCADTNQYQSETNSDTQIVWYLPLTHYGQSWHLKCTIIIPLYQKDDLNQLIMLRYFHA